MVDIHKKPGYDPVEMFTDPKDKLIILKIIWKLIKKKLGFRTVMNVIPLQAELIKGSHGRIPDSDLDWPIFITNQPKLLKAEQLHATDVYSVLYEHVTNKV